MTRKSNNIFDWITTNFSPEESTSEEFIYNDMESQSGYSLPIIYQPFDGSKRSHWSDRGAAFDFLYSTLGEGKRLLDFGPGDGWPSLLVAPYAKEVVGLDASEKRVEICRENAKRLDIPNAKFESYLPGENLPFEDNSFDGVMAASSVEQTPNPKEILKEFYRILKPGGRLRMSYESLNRYKGGQEEDFWLAGLKDDLSKLILFNRNIEEEYVVQYGLTITMGRQEIIDLLPEKDQLDLDDDWLPLLKEVEDKIKRVQVLKTIHPSGNTYANWLEEIGFSKIISTHNGNDIASKLYDQYSEEKRPIELESVDRIIKRTVQVAVELEAPIEKDRMITAIK